MNRATSENEVPGQCTPCSQTSFVRFGIYPISAALEHASLGKRPVSLLREDLRFFSLRIPVEESDLGQILQGHVSHYSSRRRRVGYEYND